MEQKEIPVYHPPRPDALVLEELKFVVLTPETVKPLLKQQGDKFLFVALTWSDYLRLGRNMNSLKSYIRQSNTLLCYYRQGIEEVFCQSIPVANDEPTVKPKNEVKPK